MLEYLCNSFIQIADGLKRFDFRLFRQPLGSKFKFMNSPSFSFFAFHVRRVLRDQPIAGIAVAVSVASVALAAAILLAQLQQRRMVNAELEEALAAGRSVKTASHSVQAANNLPKLPQFSSAELVDTVNQIAVDLNLPVDEISYTLEDAPSIPYLRYRYTLSVKTSYPLMRRFVDGVAMNLPHSILDSISCSRDDIVAATLSCDLAFSAFFKKADRG